MTIHENTNFQHTVIYKNQKVNKILVSTCYLIKEQLLESCFVSILSSLEYYAIIKNIFQILTRSIMLYNLDIKFVLY